MKLYLKQQIFSWGDKFSVYDGSGNERYFVQGEVFSFGKKLHVLDLRGNEVAFIQQRLLSFLPRYYISRNGIQFAEVVKKFTFFCHEYYINGPDWLVHGDFFNHDYQICCGNRIIAAIAKRWFSLGDAYEIDIDPNIDEIAALATVLVIDACMDAENNH